MKDHVMTHISSTNHQLEHPNSRCCSKIKHPHLFGQSIPLSSSCASFRLQLGDLLFGRV